MRVIVRFMVLAVSLSVGGCSHPYRVSYAAPLPSPLPHPTKARSVKKPRLPSRKLPVARSSVPPSKSPSAAVPPSATAKHYVVVDTVGNCAIVDDKPADGLEILGDRDGYASSASADKALKDAKAKCKGVVGTGAQAKLKAAMAKAEKLGGVQKLTRQDIEGLSYEQLKQLRGY